MSEFTLASLWERLCARPGHCFLSAPDRDVSYGELETMVRAELARFDDRALQPGSRVLILIEDERQAIATFIAAILDGMTAVMLAPGTPEQRVAAITGAVEPGLVCRAGPPASERATRLPRLPSSPDAPAYILFTSGTTQSPSGVTITRDNLLANLATLSRLFGCDQHIRIFNDMVLAHADGMIQGPLLALANGATVIRAGGFSIHGMEPWLDRIGETRATHVVTVPTVWALIDRYAARDDYFSGPECRYLMSVAAKLDTSLWRRIETRFERPLYNEYGLTETVASALYAGPHPEMGPLGTIGKPVDCEARIDDGGGREAETGQPGELQLRGRNVFAGYWKNPVRTAESFAPGGWLRTGDLAVKREDGAYEILGRMKTIVMMAGFLIRPEEIDEAMTAHPSVSQAVTVGLPHEEFGEIPVTAVVLDAPAEEAALAAHARQRLEPLKVPKRIVALTAIPRGLSGKPNLGELRLMLEQALAGDQRPPAAEDDLSRAVLALAAQVFRADPSALSLASGPGSVPGWDSFSHVTLMFSAGSSFGVDFDMTTHTRMSSLGDLVEAIAEARARG